MEPLTLAAAIASLIAGAIAPQLRDLLSRHRAEQKVTPISAPTIESRADELAEILKRSTTLLNELTAEIEARTATAQEMEAKAKHAENLAAMHEEQRQAVEKLLDARLEARLKESDKKTFFQGVWLNIISGAFFFGAGVLVTLTLGR